MFLSGFTYEIMYKSTKNHTNADALSRLPVKSNENDEPDASDIFNIEQIENLHVTAMEIARETKRNPMLSCVYQHVTSGWKKPCRRHISDAIL